MSSGGFPLLEDDRRQVSKLARLARQWTTGGKGRDRKAGGLGKELGSLLAETSGMKGPGEGRGQSEGAGVSTFGSESPVSVCSAATTESHRPGGLEAEVYFSQFWGAEVRGQVPAGAGEAPCKAPAFSPCPRMDRAGRPTWALSGGH